MNLQNLNLNRFRLARPRPRTQLQTPRNIANNRLKRFAIIDVLALQKSFAKTIQQFTFGHSLQRQLKNANIDTKNWNNLAQDRDKWKQMISDTTNFGK